MDRTKDWLSALKSQRTRLGRATPADEILRPPRTARGAFRADATTMMQRISAMAAHLLANQAAYALDDGLNGLTEAERDELDAEGAAFMKTCTELIGQLAQAAVGGDAPLEGPKAAARAAAGKQATEHRQAMLQHLTGELRGVAQVCDANRGMRLRRAMEAREGRLGASRAASSGSSLWGGGGGGASAAQGDSNGLPPEWGAEELLPEEELDEAEQAELQLENEALRAELEQQVV